MEQTARIPLFALATTTFVMGTVSLSVVGLAQPMATDLGSSLSLAAHLVMAFALTFAVAAPATQVLLGGRFSRRSLIVVGLGLIAVGSIAGALAESELGLIGSRIVLGLGGALVTPSASAAGAALLPAEQRPRALAAVFAGLTIATVAGVPLTAWLGLGLGWRGAMLVMAGMAMLSALAVRLVLKDTAPGLPVQAATLWGLLENPPIRHRLAASFLQMGAQFVTYALLGAFLIEHHGLAPGLLPAALLVFGVGGVAGNALVPWLTDRLGLDGTILLSLAGLGVVLLGMLAPWPTWAVLVMLAAWAATGLLFMAPQQAALLAVTPPEGRGVVLALNGSALYLGMSAGSAFGALVHGLAGAVALPVASVAMLALATLLLRQARLAPA